MVLFCVVSSFPQCAESGMPLGEEALPIHASYRLLVCVCVCQPLDQGFTSTDFLLSPPFSTLKEISTSRGVRLDTPT